ncbi:ABC transporter permease [Vagococcus elongatus]|nr:ABC transporter permease [Vagococcus elongatus]
MIANFFTNLFSIASFSIAEGLMWSLLAVGIFVTYRILDVADLTTEGSFPLGGAITAALIMSDLPPIVATIGAVFGGMLAGLVSGIIHTKLKIPALLAGIITMTGLYSINSRVMGKKPNQALLGKQTIFNFMDEFNFTSNTVVIIIGLVTVLLVIGLLYTFFRTEIGLSIISTGDNIEMSQANGINTDFTKILGYMIANGMIALSGSLIAQNNGYADISSGIGTIVIGLAAIIISEVLFSKQPLLYRMFSVVLGAIIYRFILALILELPIEANDNKFFSAVILVVALSFPLVQKKLQSNSKRQPKKRKGGVL